MDVRIDKWLWAVRLFKTRSLAAEACKKGKVLIQGQAVKPSRMVSVGDVVQIKRAPVLFSFKVLALAQNRMNAKLVPDFMQNITTPDQLQLLEMIKLDKTAYRERGTGRPTKKERRDLDSFVDETPYFLDDEDDWDFDD
ncbi:MAG: RNA-binding S4 domain-containing protein [Paludibacteraceae bacterium]|jgi:ribosome-associated heat shock protein Hsp15|nr:RNA-binding S4 domain-containing protein [Paludibacteraceae bacterium]MDI9536247.1 RNA-binding S4 domain-containing protein [Bacteroidota bacterium]HHT60984.1 RNA-binding S4 domain-containing protein [Bacteroidales bacterium]MBP9040054.1 RNA-binding S4 domain-containing protein [Paludibacteraceae bacterium]HOA46124.1 RNA-binding S4 domain-containing protein [Paludibacteraceae bacterium]